MLLCHNETANIPIKVVTITNTTIPIIQITIPDVAKESPRISSSDLAIFSFDFAPRMHPIMQKNIPKKFNIGMKLSINPIMPVTNVAIARSSFFMNKHLE